ATTGSIGKPSNEPTPPSLSADWNPYGPPASPAVPPRPAAEAAAQDEQRLRLHRRAVPDPRNRVRLLLARAWRPGQQPGDGGGDGHRPVHGYGHRHRPAEDAGHADGRASTDADGRASTDADGRASTDADGRASTDADGRASTDADGRAYEPADSAADEEASPHPAAGRVRRAPGSVLQPRGGARPDGEGDADAVLVQAGRPGQVAGSLTGETC